MDACESGAVSGPTSVQLLVVLEATDDERDRSTRQLRTELRELDVESVTLVRSRDSPRGAKVADPVTLGAIIVALSASGGVLTSLIDTVRDWLGRHSADHKVIVTIDGDTIQLDHATADEQRDIVDAYIRRHTTRAG